MEKMISQADLIRSILYSISLEPVKDILKHRYQWSSGMIELGCQQYLNYLYLCWRYPDKDFYPLPAIQTIWREHYLQSRDYRDLCLQLFPDSSPVSLSLQHVEENLNPLLASPEKKAATEILQEYYAQEFGKKLEDISQLSTFAKLVQFIQWTTLVTLLLALLTNTVVNHLISVVAHNNRVITGYTNTATAARDVSSQKFNIKNLCEDRHNTKILQTFLLEQLFMANRALRQAYYRLHDQMVILNRQNLLSKRTQVALNHYLHETDTWINAWWNICQRPLPGYNEIDNQRIQLNNLLDEEQQYFLHLQGFLQWFSPVKTNLEPLMKPDTVLKQAVEIHR